MRVRVTGRSLGDRARVFLIGRRALSYRAASRRTGYKVVHIFLRNDQPTGEYEDFLTGFVINDSDVWGRPGCRRAGWLAHGQRGR